MALCTKCGTVVGEKAVHICDPVNVPLEGNEIKPVTTARVEKIEQDVAQAKEDIGAIDVKPIA